jgi:hypothetical protein
VGGSLAGSQVIVTVHNCPSTALCIAKHSSPPDVISVIRGVAWFQLTARRFLCTAAKQRQKEYGTTVDGVVVVGGGSTHRRNDIMTSFCLRFLSCLVSATCFPLFRYESQFIAWGLDGTSGAVVTRAVLRRCNDVTLDSKHDAGGEWQ